MYDEKQRPSWWLIYLSLPIMIGLFLIQIRLPLSDTEHRLVEFIILLVIYGSISIWLQANTGALIRENLEGWQAALREDSSPISPQSVRIVRENGNLNRQPEQIQESIYRRLVGWASALSGFFH
jgi:hypothetical protein